MDKELEDQFYEQVAREIAVSNYQPAPMARAVEKSAGSPDLAKSLYVKFRIEQLVREYDQETRRRQREAEQLAITERRQAAERAQAIAEEKIRQKKSDQLRQQREAEEAQAAYEERRKEEMERDRKTREIDEIARQRVFERKQKEGAERAVERQTARAANRAEAAKRAVARQKARADLVARVRLYLVQRGVISGVEPPLPEGLKRSASSWDVHFGGLMTDESRTGFVKRGRLRIENGTIVIDGWKLFNKALRVVIGIVLACALTWAFHRLDENDKIDPSMGSASVQRLLEVSFYEKAQQIIAPNLPFRAIWNIKGSLYIGISICIAVYVSSYHLALPGSGTFVPVNRPRCRGRSLTMKIRPPECQKARRVCLRFRSHLDARVCQSHFEQ